MRALLPRRPASPIFEASAIASRHLQRPWRIINDDPWHQMALEGRRWAAATQQMDQSRNSIGQNGAASGPMAAQRWRPLRLGAVVSGPAAAFGIARFCAMSDDEDAMRARAVRQNPRASTQSALMHASRLGGPVIGCHPLPLWELATSGLARPRSLSRQVASSPRNQGLLVV